MRRLFLIRHAKAELAVGRVDHARRLTGRGRDDAKRIAKALEARRFLPAMLIHSGASRARETAQILAATWRDSVPLEEDGALYDASLATLIDRASAIADARESVGLVAHNPGLGQLATALAASGARIDLHRLAEKYPTGAVAVLDFAISKWAEIERHSATLALFLTPSELESDRD